MNSNDLAILVRQGEGQQLEFKRKIDFPEKVIKEVIAFANSDGGNLLIGVDDGGNIVGVKDPESEIFILQKAIKEYCRPYPVFATELVALNHEKSVINFKISKSSQKPHYLKLGTSEQTYIRISDKSIKASYIVNEVLRKSRLMNDIKFRYGENEQLLMEYLDKHSFITLETFMKISKLNKYSAGRRLIKLVLANVLKLVPSESEDKFYPKDFR